MGRMPRAWVLALVVLCGLSLWLRFSHISASLPYPLSTDEVAVLGPARAMLVSGSLRPKTFNYPSFPKYVAGAGLAAGFVRAARVDGITNTREIGRVSYPFYQTPTAVETARQLFAALSVIALGATGVLAWYITRRPTAIVVAPLVLTTSSFFFSQSWRYLNVDVIGTCMVALTLVTCLSATARPSVVRSAMIPGLWAGLATASKYTLGVAFLPVLLGIVMYQKGDRQLVSIIVAGASLCLMFLIAVPYSLLDLPGFLNGVASEVRHYSRGHVGFDGEPGLAAVGMVTALLRDWRRDASIFPGTSWRSIRSLRWPSAMAPAQVLRRSLHESIWGGRRRMCRGRHGYGTLA